MTCVIYNPGDDKYHGLENQDLLFLYSKWIVIEVWKVNMFSNLYILSKREIEKIELASKRQVK